MKAKPVQVVYGPGTFLNRAVAAVNLQVRALLSSAQQQIKAPATAARQVALGRGLSAAQAAQAAKAAQTLASNQQTQPLERLYLNSGISGTPKIDDPQFIPQIVFDQTRGVNQPKSRFAYLFPTANSALIQVRLKASLSDEQQAQAISWIRQAVQMPMFASAYGGTYTVSGEPVVVNDLATKISGSIAGLLIAAVLVMAATLLLVFRSRLRLLPLAIALAAAGITFGALSLVGGTLTMASIAVLPILIGLAVDYAIQFQSRAQEARRGRGRSAGRRRRRRWRGRPASARRRSPWPRWPRRPGSSCSCSRRSRWSGASACCWWWGSRSPSPARWPPDRRRWCWPTARAVPSGPPCAARGRSSATPGGELSAPLRRAPRLPRIAARQTPLEGWRGVLGSIVRTPGPRPRRRRAAGRARLGGRHPDLGPVRRDQARSREHAGAAEPAHARARHRRLRRDRRGGRCRRRRHAPGGRLDAELRQRAPAALRLSGDQRLRLLDPVPGAVASRSVLGRHPERRPPRRRPASPRSAACSRPCPPISLRP